MEMDGERMSIFHPQLIWEDEKFPYPCQSEAVIDGRRMELLPPHHFLAARKNRFPNEFRRYNKVSRPVSGQFLSM